METLPPEPAPLPPVPPSAHRQVLAAYDRIAEGGRPELLPTLRPFEDVLVEAKAVDVRVRAGESLPLVGLLAAVTGTLDLSDTAVRRLADAGAIVLGTTTSATAVALGLTDLAIGTEMAACEGTAVLTPTPGLVPRTVVARSVADGQQALIAMTGPDPAWPAAVRLAVGERPKLAIAGEGPDAFRKAVDDLLAAGASVETIDSTELHGDHDALLLPAGVAGPRGLPAVTVAGVTIVARPFEDQVVLDLAAYLNVEQLKNPYPATGIDLVVFGTHLRGQPLNAQLVALGARYRGQVLTSGRYRLYALPSSPPKPGVRPVTHGAPLAGERWTISPAGLGSLRAGLPGLTLAEIELADGSTAAGFHCTARAAAKARDITEFGDWRAYLRYLTATRPMSC
ncbi:hypothetical protein [Amycolatopsis sp. GM8]|uniref:allophanate hydrolase-related protein n=1 Tax=Amycolatopsis sp. GM8 TaxID=2896530 RepID=UPI001F30B46A|nr:hypothetical protein [Amycolatopsis sp. GM8]